MGLQMNTFWAVLQLGMGLAILWKSADWLVEGSVAIAERLGVSPIILGLTVVAMGTSAPEVAASIAATLQNAGDIAIGNVYGSNIANLALVGGICALIKPLAVQKRILRQEIPAMTVTALLLFAMLRNLYLSRAEAAGLGALFAALMAFIVHGARKGMLARLEQEEAIKDTVRSSEKLTTKPMWISVILVLVSLAGLAFGAKISLTGAVFIGRKIGLSEAVIGLTIIAVGTSLPELVTSVVAVLKEQHDISVGNLVGSNIFNTMFVTGSAGLVRPFSVSKRFIEADFAVMVGVSVAFGLMALIGKGKVTRISGLLLLASYAGYIAYLLAVRTG